MSDFVTVPLNQVRLDPSKRVNYSLGLVLGVDEFNQEQTYFMEKDRLHNRALHGYGTVHGLQVIVRINDTTEEPEVVVSPGMAVDQQGRYICIPEAQCGPLNEWLERHSEDIPSQPRLPLYVLLCYRECETDKVPIPGGPCRTQEESMKGSRIAEDFELRLAFDPPPQVAEEVIRKFGELLNQIEITDEQGQFLDEDELCDLVRQLLDPAPLPPGHYRVRPNQASDMLRAAFCVWTTEVRPALLKSGHCGGTLGEVEDACVLLAELDVGIEQAGAVFQVVLTGGGEADVQVDESSRPYLLSTRLLQELILFGGFRRETIESQAFASLYTKDNTTLRVWVHYPVELKITKTMIEVEVNDSPVTVSSISHGAGTSIFDLNLSGITLKDTDRVIVKFDAKRIKEVPDPQRRLLDVLEEMEDVYIYREDHILFAYLVIDWPTLDDLSDVDAPAPNDGEALTWTAGTWQPGAPGPGGPAGGDLSGNYPDPTVNRIQGQPVAQVDPTNIDNGDVLTWNSGGAGQWEPQPHNHFMNDLLNVDAPAPDQGDILILEGNGKDLWKPRPHNLNTLVDVDASPDDGDALTWNDTRGKWEATDVSSGVFDNEATGDVTGFFPNLTVQGLQGRAVANTQPGDKQVLTWNLLRNNWEPQSAQTSVAEGEFVQALDRPYAIVAAGLFASDGSKIKPSYNQLEADRINTGVYRLHFPDYQGPSSVAENPTYIVKCVILNPDLEKAYDFEKQAFRVAYINQATFQVSQFQDQFIEIWITRPSLDSETIRKVIQEEEVVENVIQFLPVDLPFMVEISQYDFKEIDDRFSRVDLNTASAEEIEALPRLGRVLAERIVTTRESVGELESIDDLIAIDGISGDAATEIRPMITFGS